MKVSNNSAEGVLHVARERAGHRWVTDGGSRGRIHPSQSGDTLDDAEAHLRAVGQLPVRQAGSAENKDIVTLHSAEDGAHLRSERSNVYHRTLLLMAPGEVPGCREELGAKCREPIT